MTKALFGHWGEVLALALASLRRNKLRSLLTMLGMIFGVASVVAMLSVGAGARSEILERIGELGIRNVIVNSVQPPQEKRGQEQSAWAVRYGITFDDEERIRELCPGVERVLPVNRVKTRVWHGSNRVEATVLGVLPEHLVLFGLEATRGRRFGPLDEAEEAKVCVVRRGLARELGMVDDPIGQTIQVGRFPFRIIGVLEDERFRSHTRKALAIDDRTHEVYVPYSSSMRTLGTMTRVERAGSEERSVVELDQLIVIARDAAVVEPTARVLAAILERFHDKRDYEIVVPLELLQQSERAQEVFNIVMVLIAAISLVVGGIGIANIMLATITERTREIGVRRALGATRFDVTVQFLAETAAIGCIGGLIGCGIGLAAIRLLVQLTGWQAVVAPQSFAVSLGIATAVAVVSGIYPARRAAQLDPIAALRHE